MSNYLKCYAADEIAAAFGAVLPTGGVMVATAPAHRDGIARTGMTMVFGQARRPRRIPL